jgi:hypothetical protein
MRKYIVIIFLISAFINLNSQELKCNVTVNSDQIRGTNKAIFETLEKAIDEYVNKTKWTKATYKAQERIQCTFIFNITEQPNNNSFKGSLQIQVARPVFNSTYLTPIFNFNDTDLSFNYEEYEPLIYNENSFDSNLVSIINFYVNIILGIDADTFAYKGGDLYFKKAEKVMLTAQQGGFKGWNLIDGSRTRYQLIDNMLNAIYKDYRFAMYQYHLKGLDTMFDDKKKAKNKIAQAIINLQRIYSKRPNSYLLRVFLDTKADEIKSIFTDGPHIDTRGLKDMLMRVYASRNKDWEKIK